MDTTHVRYEVDGHVATITLDRPEAMNSVTPAMIGDLVAAIERVGADDRVRCAVVTGSGRAFCAGADLSRREETFDLERQGAPFDASRNGARAVASALFDSPKPFIAAINGPAVGFGLTLTLPMDIRICAEDAKLGFVFTRRGMIPDAAATWFLPRIVGHSWAAEWTYSGRVFRADEAQRAGLVRSLHPASEVLATARELAREIAAASPVAVTFTRALLWRGAAEAGPEPVLDIDSAALRELGAGPDAAEGVTAFLDRREPEFTGSVSADLPSGYGWWRAPTPRPPVADLAVGQTFELVEIVDDKMVPGHVGGAILSTPSLVSMVEKACRRSVLAELMPERDTVGIHVDLSHEGIARVGEVVTVSTRLIAVDGHRLTFEVGAEAGAQTISRGRHQRAIVDRTGFGADEPAAG